MKKFLFWLLAVILVAIQLALLAGAMCAEATGLGWMIALILCCLPVVFILYPIYHADKEDKLAAIIGFTFITSMFVWMTLGVQLLSLDLLGYSMDSAPFKLISAYVLVSIGVISLLLLKNRESKVLIKVEIAFDALLFICAGAYLLNTVVSFNGVVETILAIVTIATIIGIIGCVLLRLIHWVNSKIYTFIHGFVK